MIPIESLGNLRWYFLSLAVAFAAVFSAAADFPNGNSNHNRSTTCCMLPKTFACLFGATAQTARLQLG